MHGTGSRRHSPSCACHGKSTSQPVVFMARGVDVTARRVHGTGSRRHSPSFAGHGQRAHTQRRLIAFSHVTSTGFAITGFGEMSHLSTLTPVPGSVLFLSRRATTVNLISCLASRESCDHVRPHSIHAQTLEFRVVNHIQLVPYI